MTTGELIEILQRVDEDSSVFVDAEWGVSELTHVHLKDGNKIIFSPYGGLEVLD